MAKTRNCEKQEKKTFSQEQKIILKAELPAITVETRRQWNCSAEAN